MRVVISTHRPRKTEAKRTGGMVRRCFYGDDGVMAAFGIVVPSVPVRSRLFPPSTLGGVGEWLKPPVC